MPASQSTQMTLDLGHRVAMGKEDFLVSPANQDAVAWIDMWPKWPAPALIIQGPAASGKSHLAAVWKEKSRATFVAPEDLGQYEADEIAARGQHLIIDHLDPWIGDRQSETTLFHLYNILKAESRSMLLTMRMTPKTADFVIADLASRLRAAPLAAISPPDDSLLAAVLIKLFNDRQIQIGHDVLTYILPRMDRSFDAACNLVRDADKLALAEKRAITIPLVRKLL